MKWEKIKWKLKYGLIGLLLGIIFLEFSVQNVWGYLKEPLEVKEVKDVKKLQEGDHVKLEISVISDCLISEATTFLNNGRIQRPSDKSRYYIVPFIEEHYKYYLTLKVPSDDFESIELAMDACDEWFFDPDSTLSDKPTEVYLTVDGLVKNMNDDEKTFTTYYKGYMNQIYVEYSNKTRSFILCITGLVIVLASAVLLVSFIRSLIKQRIEAVQELNNYLNKNVIIDNSAENVNNEAEGNSDSISEETKENSDNITQE